LEDSIHKRYSVKLISNIVNGIVNFILVAIVPKELGPTAYGQFVYIQQFFSQFISFLDSGTSTAFFTKLSKHSHRIELIKFYYICSFAVFIILYCTIALIDSLGYLPILFPKISSEYIYLGIFYGFLIWWTTIFVYISDTYALTYSVEFLKIAHKLFSLIALIIFIYSFDFNLTKYFYFNYLSLGLFILLVSYLFIKKNIFRIEIFTAVIKIKLIIKEFVQYSSPLLIFNIFAISFSMFDIWLLQMVSGSTQTGYYGLAYSIAAMCFLFTGAMTPIITREFAKYYADENFEEMKSLFNKYVPMLYAIASFFGIFIAFQSENLLIIFTNEEFHSACFVLMVMSFYPIHQTYGQLSCSIFNVTEQTNIVKNIGIFTSLFGFILSILFIYFLKLEAFGLALKMVFVQIISVNIQLYFNSKFLDLDFYYFIKHQILTILFFILIAVLSNFLTIEFTNKIIEFLVSGVFYTVFVIIGASLMPRIFGITKEESKKIVKYILKKKGSNEYN